MPQSEAPLYRRWYVRAIPLVLAGLLFAVLEGCGTDASGPSEAAAPVPSGEAPAESEADAAGTSAAYRMAQEYISRTLRDPGAAQFPAETDSSVYITEMSGGGYRVETYVEAPNAMGEMSRTEFVIELRQVQGQNWQMVGMEVDGRKLY